MCQCYVLGMLDEFRGDRHGRIGSDDRTDRDWRRGEENEPPGDYERDAGRRG